MAKHSNPERLWGTSLIEASILHTLSPMNLWPYHNAKPQHFPITAEEDPITHLVMYPSCEASTMWMTLTNLTASLSPNLALFNHTCNRFCLLLLSQNGKSLDLFLLQVVSIWLGSSSESTPSFIPVQIKPFLNYFYLFQHISWLQLQTSWYSFSLFVYLGVFFGGVLFVFASFALFHCIPS